VFRAHRSPHEAPFATHPLHLRREANPAPELWTEPDMSLSTRCVLLCPTLARPDPPAARRLLDALRFELAYHTVLYPEESHEHRLATDDNFEGDLYEEAGEAGPDAAASLLAEAPTVLLLVKDCPPKYAANAQSRSLIDESIRGYCIVTGMTIELGPHDVFGNRGDDVLTHVGRPNFSVTFSSGGLPNDLAAYRRAFEALPCIVETRRALEQITGRVDLEIFLSF
jgi:hypothetical protein